MAMEGMAAMFGAQAAADVAAAQNAPQKLLDAEKLKQDANSAFREKNWGVAKFKYHSALMHVRGLQSLSPEQKVQCDTLIANCSSNLAAALMQGESPNWARVVESCTQGLAAEKRETTFDSKLHFRRGKAHSNLGNLERAREDLEAAQALEENDANIKRELALLARKEKASQAKADNFFASMFSASLKGDEQ